MLTFQVGDHVLWCREVPIPDDRGRAGIIRELIADNEENDGLSLFVVEFGFGFRTLRGSQLEQALEASDTFVQERAPMSTKTAPILVALFNASDDTTAMVERMLSTMDGYRLAAPCHFADLRKGNVDLAVYLTANNPGVVIFDISPPYEENWAFFKTMRDAPSMAGRDLVLTTTNKMRLDEIAGHDSVAIEVVGKPYDLQQIAEAIRRSTTVNA